MNFCVKHTKTHRLNCFISGITVVACLLAASIAHAQMMHDSSECARSDGQITIAGSGVAFFLGTTSTSSSTYGANNIISNNSTDNLIFAPSGPGYTFANSGGIDENYWAYGSTPTTVTLYGTSDALLPNLTYAPTSGHSYPLCATAAFSFSGVSCGVGFNEGAKIRHASTLETLLLDGDDNCNMLEESGYRLAQGSDWQNMYDTGKIAIETCPFAMGPILPIWAFFGATTTGCQYLSTDPNRWPPYREWLKKVLYYNPDSNYYCEDVKSILTTMSYFNAERGWDHNGALAIVQFLVDSGRCLSFLGDVNQSWRATRLAQLQTWRDTVKDQQATPFSQDTMDMPSLEDLDLQILRGPQYRSVTDAFSASHAGPKITYLIADENPFDRQTTLRFGLVDAEYMRIDLYDPLGKALYSDTRLCGEGENRWHIPGEALSHGTIYARISTMSGDVKTVKLIRL